MYFVDRQKVESCLQYMEQLQSTLEGFAQLPEQTLHQLAFERAIHMQIEAFLDIGNHIIDGFIMRDPGSYEDIILILTDEQVIDEADKNVLIPFIECRKDVVTHYLNPDYNKIWGSYQRAAASLKVFPHKVRKYLEEQLGPVSAFIPVADQ